MWFPDAILSWSLVSFSVISRDVTNLPKSCFNLNSNAHIFINLFIPQAPSTCKDFKVVSNKGDLGKVQMKK